MLEMKKGVRLLVASEKENAKPNGGARKPDRTEKLAVGRNLN